MTAHSALIFGATGFTGQAVVKHLRANNIPTVAHIRPDSARKESLTAQFEALSAAVSTATWEPDAIRDLIKHAQPTLVFGLLGITAAGAKREAERTGDKAPTYEAVDYGLTAMAIDATAELRPDARFIYLSSLGTKASAGGAYLQARWKTEQHLRASGLAHTIARPSIITGDRDEARPAETAGAVVLSGALGVLGALGAKRLKARYRARTDEELAEALVRAALQPSGRAVTLESEDL